ncbi:MAG: hypothetical protein FJW35_08190 [Acidobacteria bacterium]|nr:hypothetical protein [Acidobacteriota bacterium]
MTTQTDNSTSKRFTRRSRSSSPARSPEPAAGSGPQIAASAQGSTGRIDTGAAAEYIKANYEPGDRLAVLAINRKSGAVVQRLAPAEKIASADTLAWLSYMNRSGYEIYLSTNALREDARDRRKDSVAAIRHVYLDLDQNGDDALQRLLARTDLPKPSYVLDTSPGKHQVVWRVEGFTHEQAEALQRALSREIGADIAVTDSSRVLRLPGFYNHKYAEPFLVDAHKLSDQAYRPEQFPSPPEMDKAAGSEARKVTTAGVEARPPERKKSQSELDWAYARRALSRGESRDAVIAAMVAYRRFDKHNPTRYAERTVDKAIRSLEDRAESPTVERPGPRR